MNRTERSLLKSFQSRKNRWLNSETVFSIEGTAKEESGAIKISQQLLIGFGFDVRRHSPWDGTKKKKPCSHFSQRRFFPFRIWFRVPNFPADHRNPVILVSGKFVFDCFNLHFEVLQCSFYRLSRNVSDAAGIIKSVN